MPPVKKKPESEPTPAEDVVEAVAVVDEPAPDVPEVDLEAEPDPEVQAANEAKVEAQPDPPTPEQIGLIEKFVVHRADDGSLVEAFTFTLVPERDPHAVAALRAYGDAVGYENPTLKRDIVEKLYDLGLVE